MAPPTSARRRLLRAVAGGGLGALLLGVLAIAAALALPPVIRRRLQAGIRESIVWTPHSPPSVDARYRNNTWPGAPADLLSVWLFNITNLQEVRQGAKPVLEQVGPYVHRVYHQKHGVLWSGDGRVHFRDYTYFVLDHALTRADPDAPVATLNLALLGLLAGLHGSVPPRLVPFADLLMHVIASYQDDPDMHGLFTVKPALQLLWGYQDKLLAALEKLLPAGTLPTGSTVSLLQNTSSLEEALSRGATVFNTGAEDITQLWNAEADRGHREVTSWPCPERVHGSDASQFRPGLDASSRLSVFVGDIFQSRDLAFNSTTELHGVELLRFWLDPAQAGPDPCRNVELRGLMNITGPHALGPDGQPNGTVIGPYVFVSMAMFCGADERLAAGVEGLSCDWGRHVTWVDVEPNTGATLRAYKRLMMSSRIGPLGSVLEPSVAGNLTIPMFWAEEAAEATPELAHKLRGSLYPALWASAHLGKLCWALGGGLILLGILLAVVAVELAADPDKWLLGAARDMLAAPAGPPGPLGAGGGGGAVAVAVCVEVEGEGGAAGPASEAADERQRLLGPGAAGGSSGGTQA